MAYVSLVIGLGLLVAIGGLWFRARQVVLSRLVDGVTRLRAAGAAQVHRRPAPPDHPVLALHGPEFDEFRRAWEAQGGAVLGDSEEIQPDGTSAGVARWFRDRTGTIVGWFTVAASARGAVPMFYGASEVDGGFVATARGTVNRVLAVPPTLDRVHQPADTPWETLLADHLVRAARDGRRVTTVSRVEEAQALIDRLRAHVQAWRRTQDPDQLLDLDLRAVLGEHYPRLGPPLARRLRRQAHGQ